MIATESDRDTIAWLNGGYIPLSRATISPLDRGFLYGDGVFETMRAESGHILDLGKHLERLHRSLAALNIDINGAMDWETTLTGLLARNDFDRVTASVKIVVSRGISPAQGLPRTVNPTIFLLSRRYEPPSEEAYRAGWRLVPVQGGFSPPLASHKTLNYLYFLTARQHARDQGADEAIIHDPAGNITETAAGSLLVRSSGRWWTPASPFQLPSVTLDRLMELFAKRAHGIERRSGTLADLLSADTVWVVNSLMLIMPASRVAGHVLPDPAGGEAAQWRQTLLVATRS
jgi:branched-chain amino acid aminotransferase